MLGILYTDRGAFRTAGRRLFTSCTLSHDGDIQMQPRYSGAPSQAIGVDDAPSGQDAGATDRVPGGRLSRALGA